jgi:HPt (histidine-containing phosphotransfer) domain-containing protein
LNQAAHSLKGASRSIGANDVAKICEAMEGYGRNPSSGRAPSFVLLEKSTNRLGDLMNGYLNRAA